MRDTLFLEKHGYTWRKNLGEGTYGQVVCAYSTPLKRNLAIKIIDTKKANSTYTEKFLSQEKDIILSLNHPHIVKTMDIFEQKGSKVYVVMELCVNGDLLQYIKTKGPLCETNSCMFFTQLCKAIQYLHSINVAHRDLKCENLLLDKSNNLKVCDFSFSKRLTYEDDQMTLSTTFCGTTLYAPPEILCHCPYNPKVSDVWSMGVVLYRMLYAILPFHSSNIKKMVRIQKRHNIFFPNNPPVSSVAKKLIESILHPVVEQRITISSIFQSAWVLQNEPSTSDLRSGQERDEKAADDIPLMDKSDPQEGP